MTPEHRRSHRGVVRASIIHDYPYQFFEHYRINKTPTLAHPVAKRKAEFLAGRFAARQAMQVLGTEGVTAGVGADRTPIRPSHRVGSSTNRHQS